MAAAAARLTTRAVRYLRDPAVAPWRKLVGFAALAYALWPLDALPDAVPVLGWLDDVGVFSLAGWFFHRELRRHQPAAPAPD
jgi:uncharacterized membrane protein YkvA (DUF1232 family)